MLSTFPLLFVAVGVIMLASLTGVVFTWKYFDHFLQPRLNYIIAVAMGVFVVIVYGLLREVFHTGVGTREIAAFFIGIGLLELCTSVLPKDSHHHHHGSCETHKGPIDARRVLIGDAIHNVHDGLVLVPAFLVSPAVGIGTAVGIFLHEIVQEIAEFFILRKAGYSIKKALGLNALVSTTILIGVGLALFVTHSLHLESALVALAAGGFTYIILRDLAPTVYSNAKHSGAYGTYVLMFLLGTALMLAVTVAVSHGGHDDVRDLYPLPEGFELVFTEASPVKG